MHIEDMSKCNAKNISKFIWQPDLNINKNTNALQGFLK